jgi:NhaP-type Na+/H+ or K+/H+ antiporter
MAFGDLPVEAFWFIPLLLLVVRPLAVWLGCLGTRTPGVQRGLMAWFGIRGIGSVYYLMYAVQHGLPSDLAVKLIALTLATVAVSVVVHGISVTPLMTYYRQRQTRRRLRAAGPLLEE